MKPLISMRYTLVLFSAFALGMSTASADENKCDRRCDQRQASAQVEKTNGQKMAKQLRKASARTSAAARTGFLLSTPAGNYHVFEGIVADGVINRRDDKVIDSVSFLSIGIDRSVPSL